MKAVRFYDKGDIRVEHINLPAIGQDELLVKMEACAICGTDLKMYLSGNPRVKPPQTIGHEFVGRIIEVGKKVMGFAAGERVTMATSISCGRCDDCRAGYTNRCETLTCISYDYPGAFAEYIAIPAQGVNNGNVIKVPEHIGDIAALAEPISCAVNAQLLANVKMGATVVIMGCGPLGALHIDVAKANGATKVIVTGSTKQRLKFAEQFDVDKVVDISVTDPIQAVMQQTGGKGADVVIVTIPTAAAQEQSLSLAKKGGSINLFASLPKGASDLKLDSRLIHYRELFISGASDSTPYHVQLAVKLLSKGLISENNITHRLSIDSFLKGIELMNSRQCLKVIIKPEL